MYIMPKILKHKNETLETPSNMSAQPKSRKAMTAYIWAKVSTGSGHKLSKRRKNLITSRRVKVRLFVSTYEQS
jgi:hypothetical protein